MRPTLTTLAILVALGAPANAVAAPSPQPARQPVTALGTLVQLPGSAGCLVDRSTSRGPCASARALRGPGPFLGSRALAISPEGRNVYVASSRSNAIAIFTRDARTGRLTQAPGTAGCVAAGSAGGCARAVGLRGPNSVAVSGDGRTVYATSQGSDAVTVFRRSAATGALTQRGCISGAATSGCTTGRALDGPDVVVVSPDGRNVYVGSFVGNAVATFTRDRSTGALRQPSGTAGCIANTPTSGCATGLALAAPEGLAVSTDGKSVYAATAVSNAIVTFARTPSSGTLTQATDGTGCTVATPLAGCTTGVQLAGANAVAVSPDDHDVYVTSLLSNSVTSFTRGSSGRLTQQTGTSACVVYRLAVGCSLGRALDAPEGLVVSPDGADVYAAGFTSGAIAVLNRSATGGALMQKPRRAGCLATGAVADCSRAHALRGVSSLALSPDGRFLYSAAFASNAVGIFKRVSPPAPNGLG